jgi:hypothetical protein
VRAIDDIARELRTQADFLRDHEPVYERALALFTEALRSEFGARLEALWAGRTFNASYERPLLLLAALRYDALCEGPAHPLHAALAHPTPQRAAVTSAAFAAALSPERTRFSSALRERFVQTNETTRAVSWLWPTHLLWSLGEQRSLALIDLGTSAGLNLIADGLPALWTDSHGAPIPIGPRPPIALRLGLDIAPLDVRHHDDAMWLRACVWPSDRARLARLEEAIALFIAKNGSSAVPRLEACSLPNAPARLASIRDELLVFCVQTIVRDYLAPADRELYEARMREFLLRRPPCSAVIAELEVDPNNTEPSERSAGIVLRFKTRNDELHDRLIARTHPHPRRLYAEAEAIAAFKAAFSNGYREGFGT